MSCLFLTESISPLISVRDDLVNAEELAARARERRDEAVREALANGVSQRRVAELTGLTQPRIAQIKKGMA